MTATNTRWWMEEVTLETREPIKIIRMRQWVEDTRSSRMTETKKMRERMMRTKTSKMRKMKQQITKKRKKKAISKRTAALKVLHPLHQFTETIKPQDKEWVITRWVIKAKVKATLVGSKLTHPDKERMDREEEIANKTNNTLLQLDRVQFHHRIQD